MKTELLAPAGSYSKLETALHFGADAVYIGGKAFSLRTFADNFTEKELCSAVDLAHRYGKKIYVAANVFARNGDFENLKDYFRFLKDIGTDAAIVSDPGVIYVAKESAPELPLHLSTQANTVNKYAVRFWKEQGISRIILARELSVSEISEIRDLVPDIQLEAFVHGAMCISYSGRCLLSDYLDGRSSNRGACVQACRWKYEIRALNPSDGETGWLPVEEDEKGTYILNSKDLNMLLRLSELERAGVNSFKIEGRMKSEYYLATVINAYRRALDSGASREIEQELCNVAHRDYTQAYASGKNSFTVGYTDRQTKGDYTYIANVIDSENGFVIAEMRNRFRAGDVLEVLSPDGNFKKTFVAENIFDSSGQKTDDAKLVREFYRIECPFALKKGDLLRRKNSAEESKK